jgi:hypothetical protein
MTELNPQGEEPARSTGVSNHVGHARASSFDTLAIARVADACERAYGSPWG